MAGSPNERARTLVDREVARYRERTPASRRMHAAARRRLPLGVPSSFQFYDPYPVVAARSEGSALWDVDGNRYADFNMGYGALLTGHSHPVLMKAVEEQLRHGTLFVTPCERGLEVAELLCERFGLDQIRFTNSGTEATMDAIRVARAATGRDRIVKVEGCYHGHHDEVMMSVKPELVHAGATESPRTVPFSRGIPRGITDDVLVVPFNHAGALERALTDHAGEIAAFILEPVPENMGIVLPDDGYLAAVRDLTTRHGVILIFDEVKTGITAGPGGVTREMGVEPDLICLAKSIGGGLPIGAFGGRADLMREIAEGHAVHLGTFNGNPLVMAAALAVLRDVVTTAAFEEAVARNDRLLAGCERVIADSGLPAHTVKLGAKGSVTYANTPVRNYRDYKATDFDLAFAHWLWMINRGVLLPPGLDEQWLISVQHTDEDIEQHLAEFAEFAAAVTA